MKNFIVACFLSIFMALGLTAADETTLYAEEHSENSNVSQVESADTGMIEKVAKKIWGRLADFNCANIKFFNCGGCFASICHQAYFVYF